MAEGARLESVFRGNSNVGSNPTLSAIPVKTARAISEQARITSSADYGRSLNVSRFHSLCDSLEQTNWSNHSGSILSYDGKGAGNERAPNVPPRFW